VKPYFTDGTVSLYVGDCREVLPALGITADLIVADPPYGETSLTWDRWPDGWLAVAADVAPSLWCFGSMRMFGERWTEYGAADWKLSQDIIGRDEDGAPVYGDVHVVWEKRHGTGIANDRFRRVHEHALHWYRGPWRDIHHNTPRTNYAGPDSRHGYSRSGTDGHTGALAAGYRWQDDGTRLMKSVMPVRSMWRRGAIHKTEKPVELLHPLIEYACPPSGLVVDVFAGSASTLDAARQSGRRAIGIEISEAYAEKAARRLSQLTREAS
jgi:site-specific DNA-methyltransferase (adenine-specific)